MRNSIIINVLVILGSLFSLYLGIFFSHLLFTLTERYPVGLRTIVVFMFMLPGLSGFCGALTFSNMPSLGVRNLLLKVMKVLLLSFAVLLFINLLVAIWLQIILNGGNL